MAIGKEFFELMDSIGYSFKDLTFLERALTHTSYTNEMKKHGIRAESNETLEFLGDAVLQIIVSETLYRAYSKQGEGMLTVMRKNIVCESSLAQVARGINLGDYLNIGSGDEATGIRESTKVLADAMEALIAAIYLDDKAYGGENYFTVISKLFSEIISSPNSKGNVDYKTLLQQFVETNGDSILRYDVLEESGPDHCKLFKIAAIINNNVVGKGSGKTKKLAEMEAAKQALALFGVDK